MQKKKDSKHHKIILFFVMFLLLGGVITLLNQVENRQTNKSKAAGDCSVNAVQLQTKVQEQALLDLINTYRAQKGVPALVWSAALKKPAAWMSTDMFSSKELSHTDSLGRSTNTRLPDCGFPISTAYGETIATGPPNAQEIFNAWKTSPPHDQIISNASYKQAAIAMEVDATGQVSYWTMNLAGNVTGGVSPTIISGTQSPSIPVSGTPPVTTVIPTATVIPISSEPNNPTPTVGPSTVDMKVTVKVKISGIGAGGNVFPKHLSRRVGVLVYGGSDPLPVAMGNGFVAYDKTNYFTGTISLGRMNEGVYYIKLVSGSTLFAIVQPEFQLLKANVVNALPTVTLVQGDLTEDNIISIEDFNIALECFQDKKCDLPEEIDFNDDGLTDVTDYNLLLRSFAEQRGN